MTDTEKTLRSDGLNVFNDSVELIYMSGAKAVQNDSITITDVANTYWVHACVVDSSGDVTEDTCTIDYSNDPCEIVSTSAAVGTAYILAVVKRASA